jgi:hypothetical protein
LKILATSDTHFPFHIAPDEWPEIDVFIHAGDLLLAGDWREWMHIEGSLASSPGKLKLFCPGNHDRLVEQMESLVTGDLSRIGVQLVHGYYEDLLPNGMSLLAMPYVVNLPSWAYNREEEWLDSFLERQPTPDIVVSHGPPYKTLDAVRPEESNAKKRKHVGSKAMRRWFDKLEKKPLIWICGHIHEHYGHENIGGCHFYNVCMCDRTYKQTRSPVLIEV